MVWAELPSRIGPPELKSWRRDAISLVRPGTVMAGPARHALAQGLETDAAPGRQVSYRSTGRSAVCAACAPRACFARLNATQATALVGSGWQPSCALRRGSAARLASALASDAATDAGAGGSAAPAMAGDAMRMSNALHRVRIKAISMFPAETILGGPMLRDSRRCVTNHCPRTYGRPAPSFRGSTSIIWRSARKNGRCSA